MAHAIDTLIAAVAKRQRGYVTRKQLLALGLGAKAISYRIRIGRLIPVYAGVYAVGHVPTLPEDRAVGALLACGDGAVLSHGSAATLWGVFGHWEMPFEVTTTTARRRRGIRVHRAALTRADTDRQRGIRVTSPARTALDIAPRVTDDTLARAVNELRLAHYLRLEALRELLERFPRHPGAARLRPFAQTADNPTRSKFERDFVAFCERFGLPRPLVNTRVNGYEADAYFPVEGVIVELDGFPFHSSKDSFRGDRDRDTDNLVEDLVTVRITDDRLEQTPEKEARRLRTILARRRRRAA